MVTINEKFARKIKTGYCLKKKKKKKARSLKNLHLNGLRHPILANGDTKTLLIYSNEDYLA
jgi:hypothetical protein